jgi:hypothetical protein
LDLPLHELLILIDLSSWVAARTLATALSLASDSGAHVLVLQSKLLCLVEN